MASTRVVVHDHSGHPFQVQLARALAVAGHEVLHLHCSSFATAHGALERRPADPPTLTLDAIDHGEPFDKYHLSRRVRQELRYARRFVERMEAFGPDVVLSANTPLFAQHRLSTWARRAGVPMVLWLQDIYSAAMGTAVRARLGPLGLPAARGFEAIEKSSIRRSTAVVAISEDFVPFVSAAGAGDRVHVIENWAPLDEVTPGSKDNPWSRDHGLADQQVLLYGGTLGLKHDPGLLAELARAAVARPAVRVVVISEGLGSDWLRDDDAKDPMPTLTLLPYQDHDALSDVLATADVFLTLLEPDAGTYSVPSKVLNYHCAGRPVVASMPPENLAARTIVDADTGVVVAPGDRQGFVDAALGLLDDEPRRRAMGERARAHAEARYAIDPIRRRFEPILGLEVAVA